MAQVLAANDIVDVLGAYLELKPSGGTRFKALCPFHNEKTPSFTVSRDRQTYYCFGCEKHGDTITFLQEHEGLSFKEALQKLADRGGIRLPAFSGRDSQQDQMRMQLLTFGKLAAKAYREILETDPRGEAARRHLEARGLRPETVSRFGLGCAPDEWNTLLMRGRKEGYSDTALEASGLVKRNDTGRVYDRFRNRLLFPIRDVAGNVVAFGGRDLGDDSAKYINSPESAVYKKSRVLYGLHEARDAIRQTKSALLVEGYFDLLRCFDVGIENVVATCGTALTPEQAALIHRYAREVVVVFDGDAAGVRAALRGTGILIAAGLSVRVLVLPESMDPDDYIGEKGGAAFETLVSEALDFVTFYIRKNQEQTGTIEGRTELARELFAIFKDIEDEMRRDEYLKLLSRELGVNAQRCRQEFAKFLGEQTKREGTREGVREGRPAARRPLGHSDLDFLSILMHDETLLERTRGALADVDLAQGPFGDVLALLLDGAGADGVQRLESGEARTLYAATATAEETWGEHAGALVEERILGLQREKLRREAARVQDEIENAVRKQDETRIATLLTRKVDLQRAIERAGAA